MRELFGLIVIAVLIGLGWLVIGDETPNKKDAILEQIETIIITSKEDAYLDGQRDALMGDVRVKMNPDSTWTYTKSPWDGCGYDVKCKPNVNLEEELKQYRESK